MQLTEQLNKIFMKEVVMTIILLFLVIAAFCFVVPTLLEEVSNKNEEHIINSPWMTSEDKFHFISRWGA